MAHSFTVVGALDERAPTGPVGPRARLLGVFQLDPPPGSDDGWEVTVTAYGAGPEEVHGTDGPQAAREARTVVPIAVPDGVPRVRFVGHLRAPGASEPVQVGEQVVDVSADATTLVGEATSSEPPQLFAVLQALRPAGSGDDLEAVVRHVEAGLREDLRGVFDRPEYRIEGETDGCGQPVTTLEPWQRDTILHLSGAYYAITPRRNVQCLQAGVGYFLVAECNNLADTILWLRGAPFIPRARIFGTRPREGSTDRTGVGFNCRAVTLTDLQTALEDSGRPASGWFVEPIEDTDGARAAAVARARPGSLFVWDGHITTVLRVRERGGRKELQLFDTGGAGDLTSAPAGVLRRGKAMQESGWYSTLRPYESDDPPATHVPIAHIFLATQPAATRLRPRPLLRAGTQPEQHVVPYPAVNDRDPDAEDLAQVARDLEAQALAPPVHLAIYEGSTLRYLSRALELGVPLAQLFYSVAGLPSPGRFQARWLVMLQEGSEDAALRTQPRRRITDAHPWGGLVVELYNDSRGGARLYRPAMRNPTPEFASRLEETLTVERRQALRAGSTTEPWRDVARDDALAAALAERT